jgi:hypothetical protein
MKKIIRQGLILIVLLLSNVTLASAKDPQVLGASVPTVYGVHDPIDTSLGGVEWIFVLASLVFVIGLLLIINGKALKDRLEN